MNTDKVLEAVGDLRIVQGAVTALAEIMDRREMADEPEIMSGLTTANRIVAEALADVTDRLDKASVAPALKVA